ncbi:MAG: hypothetical protein ACK40N_07740 [Meiothermus ruber]|jgi:hypothetical protein|uniref:Lipoprotein n=1 Tax=Meiothermus ruber TaxID=277 RepID=A0A7C3DI15_MEIRU|nr:hypothetical protein [Meiothermus ruber]GIW38672.1 MAG: hypothetical protein KatS3mg075_153 [Meiothermus sp.]
MKTKTRLAIVGFAYLVASCSSFIPPQNIPNPLGLTGQQVQVEIGASAVSRATTTGLGSIKTDFPDVDTSSSPIPISLKQTLFRVGFVSDVKLSTPTGSLPCTIILTKVDIQVRLKDARHTFTLPTFSLNKVVELEQQPTEPTTYRILNPEVFVGNVLDAIAVRQLQELITSGGPNQAEIYLSVQATSVPELPPGSILTLTFGTTEATLAF